MEKKNIDWANLGFGYIKTDYRYVSDYTNGAWDEGRITEDDKITMSECAGVLQYAQTVFEGMKAYTTEKGETVVFRPDLNAARLADSARRLEMPVFPEERFLDAIDKLVKANLAWVPPFGSGATLYIRPYMFGINPVIGVKPADDYNNGKNIVAIDRVGAGINTEVIVTTGSSARLGLNKEVPADAAIVGIVD